MNHRSRWAALVGAALALSLSSTPATAADRHGDHGDRVEVLATGLSGGAGSAVGPDGALYVTEPLSGEVSRVDRRTGDVTTFASGLPAQLPGVGTGGVMDVVFRGRTAYVLTSLVGSDVGGDDVVGIYRIDGPDTATVVADVGAFNTANPSDTEFFVPSGVPYAMERVRGGFLVTDGHHNRLLRVTDDGTVSVAAAFGNVVPTGLDVAGSRVWMAEAGPLPHLPEDGRVTTLDLRFPRPREVARGGPLLVDVELGHGSRLYALAQGEWPLGGAEGSPAAPDTGQLLVADRRGDLRVVAEGLDRPTSVEIVRRTAYVVTLDGEVWRVDLRRDGRHHTH